MVPFGLVVEKENVRLVADGEASPRVARRECPPVERALVRAVGVVRHQHLFQDFRFAVFCFHLLVPFLVGLL